CGPLAVRIAIERGPAHATWRLRVRNASAEPIALDAVGLGFRWQPPAGAGEGAWRLLRQGFQSWSFAGGVPLDAAGTPPFPSGPWLRGFHHAHPEPPADRARWHESDGAALVGTAGGAACLAGALESGRAFATVFVRRTGGAIRLEVEQRLERPLAPGAALELEPVRVALGSDASALLEAFADAQGGFAR